MVTVHVDFISAVGHSVSLHGCMSRYNCVACVGVGLTPALKYCIATVYISLPQLSGHCDLCCMALHDHCECRSHSSCVATMDIGLISCGALFDHCKCKSQFSYLSTVDLGLTVAVWWSLAVGLSYAARHRWLLSCSNCVATVGVALTLAMKHNVAIVYVSHSNCGCSIHLS